MRSVEPWHFWWPWVTFEGHLGDLLTYCCYVVCGVYARAVGDSWVYCCTAVKWQWWGRVLSCCRPSHAVPRECHSLLRDLIAQIESKEAELRHDESDTLLDLQQSKHTIQVPYSQFGIIITWGQSNLTKSASRGPIPRLGVTPGVKICTIEFLG